ncbi:hypothetical protein Lal_00015104 [Lupinus albus]|nr:hypothetical protein Lal_00015104 [Lupinus albus]
MLQTMLLLASYYKPSFQSYIYIGLLVLPLCSYGNPNLNTKLTIDMRKFKDSELDFGKQFAIRERTTMRSDKISQYINSNMKLFGLGKKLEYI